MRIVRETHINFMSQRKVASLLSAIIILSGLVSLLINGGTKLSIDFKGSYANGQTRVTYPGLPPVLA